MEALGALRRRLFSTTSRVAGKAPKWTKDTVNQEVLSASYAVRGPVLDLAMSLEKKMKAGEKLPFKQIIYCNIGNPQALQQQPLTFVRQVLALVVNPPLLDSVASKFPADVIKRAKGYLSEQPMGAYSNSQGLPMVREQIANYIDSRDGTSSADPEQIFLTNGASEGVRYLMQSLIRSKAAGNNDGVLVPIPQYPLYSALATLLSGNLVPYYLKEETGWGLEVAELTRALDEARKNGVTVRGLVVINPGNPTGQLLTTENKAEIIKLCVQENLVLMADEVYQNNVYREDRPFCSFRKVALDLGHKQDGSDLQLVSFHSISKGFSGECGLRGGYFELFGIDAEVKAQLYKLASISLCSNTIGQVATGLMVSPPKEGEPSYPLYVKERDTILDSLKRRAAKLTAGLSKLEGISVQPSDGAMYSFPQITMPSKFMEEAKKQGKTPDLLYAMRLLEKTGIVVVPGSGFGQEKGTWHFRTTFLPPEDKMDSVIDMLGGFHRKFMADYA